MAAVMMVGVWLLFNSHCCAAGDVDGKVRLPLADQLTRRSALEKNFMRFGRSDRHDVDSLLQFTPSDGSDEVETMTPTSLRLKSSLSSDRGLTSVGKFYQALDSFIRLEKNPSVQLRRMHQIQDEFERGARGSDNFMRFGRGGDNFMRFGREKDNNFMRFGRRSEAGSRYARSIGEGRDKNLVRLGRQRQTDKGDGFIRFGRQFGQRLRLIKRSLKDTDSDREDYSSPFCVHSPLLTDPNTLVAPELLLLPEVFHKPPLNQDFMRLG